jgi:ATP-dependent Lon protease
MTDQPVAPEFKQDDMNKILPVLPLVDVTLFPKLVLPIIVMQNQSIQLIDRAMAGDRTIGLITTKKPDIKESYGPEDLYKIGTSALILKYMKSEDDKIQLLVQGLGRFKVKAFVDGKPYLQAEAEMIETQEVKDQEIEALMSNLIGVYQKIVEFFPNIPREIGRMITMIEEPGILSDIITSTINSPPKEKQKVLEIIDVRERLIMATKLVNYQLQILELGNKIQSQVKGGMDQKQKEYYLRQQIKVIKEELGEKDEVQGEVEEYLKKIEETNLPEDVEKEAKRELERFARMHPSSSEYTVSSTYLDWITTMPWSESTKDNLDIKASRKVLDTDHFGLEKVKKRIIEYLAVRKLKPDSKGPILCFVGPPGTGKTSLGQSIARALGRKFVRIALGGLRDEAEIRGHRRTYVGALPGRIIQEIRRVESNNPVFMLDEIDKVGSDFHGDPSSALLEVLDPEQNFSFTDHYLDLPFDLSKVMFITTANVLHTIRPALQDRLETLHLLGYTDEEKTKIANRYLIPRQREAHGLKSNQISITQGALRKIIPGYTSEAGLRNLEREIAAICRGVAAKIAQKETEFVSINVNNLAKFLGPVRFSPTDSKIAPTPGVVTGLAWTQAGGKLLVVEATSMSGKKNLTLTGQLGDVMKESAMAALSFVRTNSASLGIEKDFYDKRDIHIHVPAGSTPKDGPSAGVTILTSIVSLISEKPVEKDLAMTGEITLRGQVLPVGGIKEKVLASHRAGIKNIILPQWNKKDLAEDIPKEVRKSIKFHFVDTVQDVLDIAFGKTG